MQADLDHVRRAAQGDREAFGALYDAWSAPVFAYLVGLLSHRQEAEDALSDAFLSAWRRLAALREPGRFAPWLFAIARHAAAGRHRRRRPATGPVDAAPARPEGPPATQQVALQRALERLAPEPRAALLLRYVVGWSVDEAAEALDVGSATLKRWTAAGLVALRAQLAEEEVLDGPA